MKRVLELAALAFLVVGVELMTGAFSYTLTQLGRVYAELVLDAEPSVSLPRFFLGVGVLIVGLILLLLEVWARARFHAVHRGKACPHCGGATQRVKRKQQQRLMGWVVGERVTRRACKECDWTGLVA